MRNSSCIKLFVVLISFSFLAGSATADTTVSLANLALVGHLATAADLIQVTGAVDGGVQGAAALKPASSDTRTAYTWDVDLGMVNPNIPNYMGSSWPVIFHGGGNLIVDPAISAMVTLAPLQSTGVADGMGGFMMAEPILVNGRPIYQFCADNQVVCFGGGPTFMPDPTPHPDSALRTSGIYGTWKGVAANGNAVVPEPSTAALMGLGLLAVGMRRRSAR